MRRFIDRNKRLLYSSDELRRALNRLVKTRNVCVCDATRSEDENKSLTKRRYRDKK